MAITKESPTASKQAPPRATTAAAVGASPRFEWGVIFAGTSIAIALSIVLMQFGSIIGLAAHEPYRGTEDIIQPWGIIVTGIWILWVQLIASVTGGYAAGWLRSPLGMTPHQTEMRDGFYGLIVWATATIATVVALAVAGALSSWASVETGAVTMPDALDDAEQNAGIVFAFATGAISLVSAVASWWAATKGGEHRDEDTDFSRAISFK